jgi:hypothetical protein
MTSSPFNNSLETVAAVCDRRISAETNASALTERRYKPFLQRPASPVTLGPLWLPGVPRPLVAARGACNLQSGGSDPPQ